MSWSQLLARFESLFFEVTVVERLVAKVDVAGSTPVSRSKLISTLDTSSVLAGLSYPD